MTQVMNTSTPLAVCGTAKLAMDEKKWLMQ
jgi:hypothetical protein